jgi:Na+/phosphate symporter
MTEKPFYENPFDVKSAKVDEEVLRLQHLHRARVLETPSFREGLMKMIGNLVEMNTLLSKGFATNDRSQMERCERLAFEVSDEEKKLVDQLLSWGVRGKMATHNVRFLYRLERIGDMLESMLHCFRTKIDQDIPFTDKADAELDQLFSLFTKMIVGLRDVLFAPSQVMLDDITVLSKDLTRMVEEFRTAHWERVETGRCAPASSSLYRKILDSFKWGGEYIVASCTSLAEPEEDNQTSATTSDQVRTERLAHEILNPTA